MEQHCHIPPHPAPSNPTSEAPNGGQKVVMRRHVLQLEISRIDTSVQKLSAPRVLHSHSIVPGGFEVMS